jgi:hypothetical protein
LKRPFVCDVGALAAWTSKESKPQLKRSFVCDVGALAAWTSKELKSKKSSIGYVRV